MKYLTGSRAFFDNIDGFVPRDTDYTSFKKQEITLCHYRFENVSEFIWNEDLGKDGILEYIKAEKVPYNSLAVFLIPDVVTILNITIDFIKCLDTEFSKIDEKHKYLNLIRNFYIENDSFLLTDEQRMIAFEEYKKERSLN